MATKKTAPGKKVTNKAKAKVAKPKITKAKPKPSNSKKPAKAAKPSASAAKTKSVKPAKSAKPNKPVKPVKSSKPVKPAKATKISKPVKPAKHADKPIDKKNVMIKEAKPAKAQKPPKAQKPVKEPKVPKVKPEKPPKGQKLKDINEILKSFNRPPERIVGPSDTEKPEPIRITGGSVKRVIKDYRSLSEEHEELINKHYPEGFENEDLISFTTPKGEFIKALEIKTPGIIYLFKIDNNMEVDDEEAAAQPGAQEGEEKEMTDIETFKSEDEGTDLADEDETNEDHDGITGSGTDEDEDDDMDDDAGDEEASRDEDDDF